MTDTGTIDIRRRDQRFETSIGWLESHHSFSFSSHYDRGNTHFGLLLVNNDDIVRADTGFSTHPHRDMEIVTWVLSGEVEHKDSEGNHGIIYPGLAQRMSAGTGIWHSEMNPSTDTDVHLVQMWVVPDTERINPGYEQLDINAELDKGGLVPVASGRGHEAAISIRQKHAALFAARLAPGERLALPDAAFVHLFVPRGAVDLEGAGTLVEGDAVRLAGAGGPTVTAAADGAGAELLVWEMHAAVHGS
jgi:redox-sensitive bicupin YhaK (pirin superfamily)